MLLGITEMFRAFVLMVVTVAVTPAYPQTPASAADALLDRLVGYWRMTGRSDARP